MLQDILHKQEAFFNSGKTKSLKARKEALKKLQKVLISNEDEICDAIYSDFKKPKFESLATETQFVLAELKYIINNLQSWSQPQKVSPSLSNFPSSEWIQFEPLGKVLIISPWNYPFNLAISPLIGAIAAGNTAVLKPSELTPATSSILAKIISEVFDEEYVCVIEAFLPAALE